ncbi:zinc dependent phospholipase C family protein [Chamaesiphon sp. OTE_75_metabat_556]|uniref:zinc dependent phospholipase C family protein n=1 Tax=Chamaesiphon sp. OTE_75_metabat_556 TaxID=2964692 RepID=UPI00286C58B8|nr:zinc dependent phospholipase C family protein [Chamaesiphon sp. OTE_75_metabat_556]
MPNIASSQKIRRIEILLSTAGAIVIGCLGNPSSALSWTPTMHAYLAQQALDDALDDGKITISKVNYSSGEIVGTIGTYQVDPAILASLRANTAQYRAGVIGPDAYPDILTGQQAIHPGEDFSRVVGGSNSWLQHLWGRAAATNRPATTAFTIGYLTHAAGDMFAHTFVNKFAGGSFDIKPPKGPANAIKHFVVEGYVGKRLDARALNANFFNVSINGVESFIYENTIDARPGTVLDRQLLRSDGKGAKFSIPRIYSTLRAKLVRDIKAYDDRKAEFDRESRACTNTLCRAAVFTKKKTYMAKNGLIVTYKEAWRNDIDRGLKAWPAVSHEVGKALFFNPSRSADTQRAEAVLKKYTTDHLLSMSGAPDFVGLTIGTISSIIDVITPDFLIEPIRQLKDDLLNVLLKESIGMTKEELKEYITSPDKYFDRVVNQGAGENVTLATFNSKYLRIQDTGYTNPREAFDYRKVSAAYNTVVMSKLVLLNRSELNRLMVDLGSSSRLTEPNVMLGFVRTLDGSNQWNTPSVMVLAKECSTYRKIFMKQPWEPVTLCLNRTPIDIPTIDPVLLP